MLSAGAKLGRYKVIRAIGRGAMATVYAAQHVELGSFHAIKVMNLTSPHLISRVLQEGRIQAGMRHPNVVPVTDVLRIGGVPALVMDLVDGPGLDLWLETETPTLLQVDSLARDLLSGVGAAHGQDRIHRDLKPGNILLEVQGDRVVARVTDFGLAKVLDSGGMARSHTGVVMGTPAFMAPEQFRDSKAVDKRADVFALGAMIYQLLAGKPPFKAPDIIAQFRRIEEQNHLRLDALLPHLPPEMTEPVHAALSFDPADRPPDARAMLEAWCGDRSLPPAIWPLESRQRVYKLAGRNGNQKAAFDLDPEAGVPNSLSDQSDLVALAEASQWPVEMGGPRRTLIAQEDDFPPGEGPELPEPPAHQPSLPPPGSPSDRKWAVVGGVLAILALGGLGFWWIRDPAVVSEPEQSQEEVVIAASETPAPTSPAPESPEILEDPPPSEVTRSVTDTPEPAPSAPSSEPAPPPQTPKTQPPEAQTPKAQPVVVTKPQEPAPTPEPAPKPKTARLSVSGAPAAYLVGANGRKHAVRGELPAGDYALFAYFGQEQATQVLELSLSPGQEASVNCNAMMRVCRAQ
ncbi:MAG: serine/threonine-protein kinase [Myxococcota bacterium]|nr:serine/threonine-protein kinase [Myxococcota bacterium]